MEKKKKQGTEKTIDVWLLKSMSIINVVSIYGVYFLRGFVETGCKICTYF